MVAAALDHSGLRLTEAELLARRPDPVTQRHRPTSRRPGAVPAAPPGQGMDLREIRAFAEGDDLRRIDAAATARTGQLHVRSFHEDRDDTTLLIADFRAPMLWGTGGALRSVRAARWLALLGWRAEMRGGSVGVMVLTGQGATVVSAGTGQRQMQQIAAHLAHAHDAALTRPGDGAAHAGLVQALRLVPAGGRVHVATGPDALPGAEGALARLARGRDVTLHMILDPIETAPPALPLSVHDGAQSRHGRLRVHDPLPRIASLRALGVKAETVDPDDTG